jgi:hypothetical protein
MAFERREILGPSCALAVWTVDQSGNRQALPAGGSNGSCRGGKGLRADMARNGIPEPAVEPIIGDDIAIPTAL